MLLLLLKGCAGWLQISKIIFLIIKTRKSAFIAADKLSAPAFRPGLENEPAAAALLIGAINLFI